MQLGRKWKKRSLVIHSQQHLALRNSGTGFDQTLLRQAEIHKFSCSFVANIATKLGKNLTIDICTQCIFITIISSFLYDSLSTFFNAILQFKVIYYKICKNHKISIM